MRLIVLRHGESEADILGVHEGRADFSLTERGRRQAEALGAWLAGRYAIDRLYASTLRRARETAERVARACGVAVVPDEELMEFNNGLLAGMEFSRARELYPPVPGLPIHQAVYGQESQLDFRMRAERTLSRILSEAAAGETVAVVSHGGMINQLYRAFLRLPIDAQIGFSTGDTGVHEWIAEGGARRVVRANCTDHLSGL